MNKQSNDQLQKVMDFCGKNKLELPTSKNYQDELYMAIYNYGKKMWDQNFPPAMLLNDLERVNNEFENKIKQADLENLHSIIVESPRNINWQGDSNRKVASYEYVDLLKYLGYEFKLNELDDSIEVNNELMSDVLESEINSKLRDYDYNKVNVARDAYIANARQNRYHPIKDYLEDLEWNDEDHINKLAGYFKDKHDTFVFYLRKWLIGAVARIYKADADNRVLILDGRQDIGKSYFCRWLVSGLSDKYYVDSSINPDDKDHSIRLMRIWVWEIGELGGTVRKADRERLKNFLTKPIVSERAPYGRYPIVKSPITSFIGTVNNEIGFLDDPTGSRRYMSTTILEINWNYTQEVDIDQVWAQAKALYDSGEEWRLTGEDKLMAEELNKEYEIIDPAHMHLESLIFEDDEVFTPTTSILMAMRNKGVQGSEMSLSKSITTYLRGLGIEVTRENVEGKRVRGYKGVSLYSKELNDAMKRVFGQSND